jgi:hypothetical protein
MTEALGHDDDDHVFCGDASPVLRELQGIGNSFDARVVSEMLADFFTDPNLIALPTYCARRSYCNGSDNPRRPRHFPKPIARGYSAWWVW